VHHPGGHADDRLLKLDGLFKRDGNTYVFREIVTFKLGTTFRDNSG
jgi:hypothetical protein